MDQRADGGRTFHRVRQPDMQRELSRLSNCAAENQQRDECGACAEHSQTGAFKTPVATIVKEKCAAAAVKPEHPEKKSHVANARSDECLLCGSRCTRFLNPKPNEQIRRKPDQFPKNEKEKETVRDDQP